MTLQQILLKHWWKIIIASIAAPLIITFGYYNPEETPIGGIPVKYIATLVAGIGAYTTFTVKNALSAARKQQPNQPARIVPKQQTNVQEEDVFAQFGNPQ